MAAKTAAKKKDPEVLEEPALEEEEAPPAIVAEGAPPSPSAKRSIGAKEPIIFKWKLLGTADGVILTLFKSVEREEIDGHLERVSKEGHYTDLRIVDVAEKVVQSKSAVPVPHKTLEKLASSTKAKKPAKAPPKKVKSVKVAKLPARPAKKKPAPKKPKKSTPAAKKKRK